MNNRGPVLNNAKLYTARSVTKKAGILTGRPVSDAGLFSVRAGYFEGARLQERQIISSEPQV